MRCGSFAGFLIQHGLSHTARAFSMLQIMQVRPLDSPSDPMMLWDSLLRWPKPMYAADVPTEVTSVL